jgi:tocopherol cyclase
MRFLGGFKFIFKTLNPEIFQGRYKSRNYFEGWYFKLIDEAEQKVYAIIPGIALGSAEEEKHAFIQVIDAMNYKTYYFTYDFSEFKYSDREFNISIGDNTFCRNKINLKLLNSEMQIKGTMEFTDIVPFPKTVFNPGIMGPFAFIPFMECYHGIVNIQHRIMGNLSIDHQEVNFTNGSGYIEKDWGTSFPEAWVWLQSNHFEEKNVSIMFSIAKIPWFHKYFIGFVSFLRINEKLYRFATYTRAKVKQLEYKKEHIEIILADKKYTLTMSGDFSHRGILKAPKNGLMQREIKESISSEVEVNLQDNKGKVIFFGLGKNVGMEIVGDVTAIFSSINS